MTPKQAAKALNEMIDLTAKLGEGACLMDGRSWRSSDTKWVYMNVLLNMSNKLKDVKEALCKK